jgi:hypothetical protein
VDPAVQVAYITAVPATLAALASFVAAIMGFKNRAKLLDVETKVDGSHTAMQDALGKLTTENADRGGQLKERDRNEARQDHKDQASAGSLSDNR